MVATLPVASHGRGGKVILEVKKMNVLVAAAIGPVSLISVTPAVELPLLHEALPKLLDLATVLRLTGLFLGLLGELLPFGALGEVLGPLEE
jgi:hypothetical protein